MLKFWITQMEHAEMTRYERFPLLLLKCHMLIEDIPKGMHFIYLFIYFQNKENHKRLELFVKLSQRAI